MAQITVVYKDFEEMKAVARELLKEELSQGKKAGHSSGTAIAVPATPPQTESTAPATPAAPAAAIPTAPAVPVGSESAPPASTIPTSAPSYTRDDLANAAMTLMDKGMQGQLQQLIQGYGVASLVELPPEQYGSFATALRGLGAQI